MHIFKIYLRPPRRHFLPGKFLVRNAGFAQGWKRSPLKLVGIIFCAIFAGSHHPQNAGLVQKFQVPASLVFLPQLHRAGRHLCIGLVRTIGPADHPSLAAGRGARVPGPHASSKVTRTPRRNNKEQSILRRRLLRLPQREFWLTFSSCLSGSLRWILIVCRPRGMRRDKFQEREPVPRSYPAHHGAAFEQPSARQITRSFFWARHGPKDEPKLCYGWNKVKY